MRKLLLALCLLLSISTMSCKKYSDNTFDIFYGFFTVYDNPEHLNINVLTYTRIKDENIMRENYYVELEYLDSESDTPIIFYFSSFNGKGAFTYPSDLEKYSSDLLKNFLKQFNRKNTKVFPQIERETLKQDILDLYYKNTEISVTN